MHVDNAASVVLSHWIRGLINGLKRGGNWWMASPVPVPDGVAAGGRRWDPALMPLAVGLVIAWIGFWMKTTTGVIVCRPLSPPQGRGPGLRASVPSRRCRGGNRC